MSIIPVHFWEKTLEDFSGKVKRFSKQPWSQGIILCICVILAMLLANLPQTREWYHNFLQSSFTLNFANPDGGCVSFPRDMTVEKFINDILMTIFFFTVGLEIKREIKHGQLSGIKKALLPIIAAFGGVITPALIFTAVNAGTPSASGWGIPTATDIAFAVCILTVLGDRVPVSLKVFLTALAIVDDLIAILVVALFYGGRVNITLLLIAAAVIAVVFYARKKGTFKGAFYLFAAIVVWVLFYYSGIHSTMSGVVMAFLIPSKPRYTKKEFMLRWRSAQESFNKYENITSGMGFPTGPQRHFLRNMKRLASGATDMSYACEHILTPWVNFLIMPLFALANAGVEISDPQYFNIFNLSSATSGISLGIILGLVLGKPIGITLTSYISIKLGLAQMPEKASWKMLFAVACLGGIGFTMSIFVDTLSFSGADPIMIQSMQDAGKIAILMGSILAGITGTILVSIVSRIENK